MDYKDINDKWKSFLLENTFKEDMLINPDEKKGKINKKKSKKKVGPPPKKAKELMTDPSFVVKNEYEEFDEDQMDEWSLPTYVGSKAPQSAGYNDADSVEEEQLEEISTMSGGPEVSSVEGHMGGSKGPWMSKKAFKRKWS